MGATGSLTASVAAGDEAAELLVMAEVLEQGPDWMTMSEVRRLLQLDTLSTDELLKWLSEQVASDGSLTKEAMTNGLMAMAKSAGELDAETTTRVEIAISTLFDAFDVNHDGTVSNRELMSGLAIMTQGDRTAKLQAAFAAYDTDGNGTVTLDEMTTMLRSVYRVAYSADSSTAAKTGVDAETLATVTAQACFASADRDRDGLLTFEEFTLWASGGGASDAAAAPVAMRPSAVNVVATEAATVSK
jgi:Ca2+-binding EF-hand superfamily protein